MARRTEATRSGFTLIEIIVVIAVLAILAAVAVPIANLGLQQERGDATLKEMDTLKGALEAHFKEKLEFPADLPDLVTGEYLSSGFSGSDAVQDGWGGDYTYTRNGNTATLVSLGPDRTDAEPNYTLTVTGVPILKARTLEDMATIHTALSGYEARRQDEGLDPLPSTWYSVSNPSSSALGVLITEGLLPNSTRYAADAFGSAYGFTGTPATHVTSSNVVVANGADAGVSGGGGQPGGGHGDDDDDGDDDHHGGDDDHDDDHDDDDDHGGHGGGHGGGH